MLSPKNRLNKSKNFEATHRYGSLFSFGNISLKVKKGEKTETRIGFSVGIKFSPKAVERNRMKRQLREVARKNIKKIKKGLDIVVMVKKGENPSFESLERGFISILKKGNLINK